MRVGDTHNRYIRNDREFLVRAIVADHTRMNRSCNEKLSFDF